MNATIRPSAKTRIISNQLGYPGNSGVFECRDFDEAGLPIDVPH
jgi:hypothetical protein